MKTHVVNAAREVRELAAGFEAYADWRRRLGLAIVSLRDWLDDQGLADAQVESRFTQVMERLAQDRLVVAFVAEFSRGKSELINAIFFADFGQRLLPSSAGRTTMCPTELLHDPTSPPSIRLLPIETRAQGAGVVEFRSYPDEWVTFEFDLSSPERIGAALAHVSEVKEVAVDEARRLGFVDDESAPATDAERVEIPCWRHAIINFPHPLLQQGLVILDTPGLNAIGARSDAVVFVQAGRRAAVVPSSVDPPGDDLNDAFRMSGGAASWSAGYERS